MPLHLLKIFAVINICLPLCAQDKAPTDKPKDEPKKSDQASNAKEVTTDGVVTIDGKKITYKATTGKLTLFKDDGTPRA